MACGQVEQDFLQEQEQLSCLARNSCCCRTEVKEKYGQTPSPVYQKTPLNKKKTKKKPQKTKPTYQTKNTLKMNQALSALDGILMFSNRH